MKVRAKESQQQRASLFEAGNYLIDAHGSGLIVLVTDAPSCNKAFPGVVAVKSKEYKEGHYSTNWVCDAREWRLFEGIIEISQ